MRTSPPIRVTSPARPLTEAELREDWVTIDGNHVLIGDEGSADGGPQSAEHVAKQAKAGKVFAGTFDEYGFGKLVPHDVYDKYIARERVDQFTSTTVPIKSLYAETNQFDAKRMAGFSNQEIDPAKAPVVLRYKDKNYLMDGHHRTLSRVMRGESNVRVRMFDMGK